MRKHLLTAYSILFFVILTAAEGIAGDDGFLDLYMGAAGTWRADVGISGTTSSGTTSAAASIDLPSSTEFGIRLGAWHPSYNWLGLGIDLGYLHADGPGVDIDAFPFSILLALRAPLFPTPERPGGRLQPYAMAGVSFYVTDISVHLAGMGGSSSQNIWLYPNVSDKVIGPYLATGIAWQPTRSLAIFGEYRYSSFDVEFDTTNSSFWPTMNGRVETTVKADRILFGISHRFGANPARKAEEKR